MSADWPRVPLGEVLSPSSDPHPVQVERSYPNFGIFSFGRGLFEKPPIDGATTSARTLYRVKTRQFIYSRLFAFEGAYGFVSDRFDGWFISNEYPTFDCNIGRLLPEYLSVYFRWAEAWRGAAALSTGMGDRRQRIQPEQLLRYKIPLPPLPEQLRIVARVEAIASRIGRAQILRNIAEKDTDSFGSVSKNSFLNDLENVHPLRPLLELVTVRGGGTPSRANPLFWQGSIPWISPKDMKSRELSNAIDHISPEAIANSPAKLIEPGAVLIVVRGMILARTVPVATLCCVATINQDMKALIPNSSVDTEYLRESLSAREGVLLAWVEKSSHDTRKIETDRLLSLQIPLPADIAEQRRIVAHLRALQAKADGLRTLQAETAAELDALLPAVLAKAFAGQL